MVQNGLIEILKNNLLLEIEKAESGILVSQDSEYFEKLETQLEMVDSIDGPCEFFLAKVMHNDLDLFRVKRSAKGEEEYYHYGDKMSLDNFRKRHLKSSISQVSQKELNIHPYFLNIVKDEKEIQVSPYVQVSYLIPAS